MTRSVFPVISAISPAENPASWSVHTVSRNLAFSSSLSTAFFTPYAQTSSLTVASIVFDTSSAVFPLADTSRTYFVSRSPYCDSFSKIRCASSRDFVVTRVTLVSGESSSFRCYKSYPRIRRIIISITSVYTIFWFTHQSLHLQDNHSPTKLSN